MRGAGNYLPRGVNETNDVRRWRALSTGCVARHVDATTIPRHSLFRLALLSAANHPQS